ncbi:MAG: hypothetical protein ACJ71Z_04390 [Aeromicrobium sp.]
MNEPQVWTLIGMFAAALFGVVGLMSTMFMQLIRTEIGGLRNEMIARFEHLDRDVEAMAAKVFGEN